MALSVSVSEMAWLAMEAGQAELPRCAPFQEIFASVHKGIAVLNGPAIIDKCKELNGSPACSRSRKKKIQNYLSERKESGARLAPVETLHRSDKV